MFGKKKGKIPDIPYDERTQRPVIRCSICTGEQAAGFKDTRTGKFTEVLLIKENADLDAFMQKYGLDHIEKEY